MTYYIKYWPNYLGLSFKIYRYNTKSIIILYLFHKQIIIHTK